MAIVLPPPQQVEQKVILHGVSWETYERLLADFADSHAAHFAYDQGTLEIMVLSFRHETLNRTLVMLVETLAVELDIDLINAGSTTFKRVDLARGFEPDTGFYSQRAGHIRSKDEINLTVDPPPDWSSRLISRARHPTSCPSTRPLACQRSGPTRAKI